MQSMQIFATINMNIFKKNTLEMNRLNTACLCKLEDFQERTKEFAFIHFSMSDISLTR